MAVVRFAMVSSKLVMLSVSCGQTPVVISLCNMSLENGTVAPLCHCSIMPATRHLQLSGPQDCTARDLMQLLEIYMQNSGPEFGPF